jgi:phosphoribosyl 1,2-cyclic phosphodiesterase
MRFVSLGSGSSGNGLLVEAKRTRLLLDCGFGLRDTVKRLARTGLAPEDLTGILVTHEHADHVGGVVSFACKYKLPVWLTHGTLSAIKPQSARLPAIHLVDSHARFAVGDLEIEPFPVPHDAREPVQYVFGDGARRLGVLTDTGHITSHIENSLSGCDALVLECNHDRAMLMKGPYPPGLKQRVAGRFGHLDNDAAAGLLSAIDRSRLQHVIAAHLSEQNNTPWLAQQALSSALNCAMEWVGIADQEQGFDWRQIA